MRHSSIQVTVDIFGHLLLGANVACVDRLDSETSPQKSATSAPLEAPEHPERAGTFLPKVLDRRDLVAAEGLEPSTYGL